MHGQSRRACQLLRMNEWWWKLKDVTRLPELKKQTRKDHEVQDLCGPQGARPDDDRDQVEKDPYR